MNEWTKCPVCTLVHPFGDKCPNGWREDRNGILREREPGKHEAARPNVEGYRVAMERVAAERQS